MSVPVPRGCNYHIPGSFVVHGFLPLNSDVQKNGVLRFRRSVDADPWAAMHVLSSVPVKIGALQHDLG
jgi:hypothetical protein